MLKLASGIVIDPSTRKAVDATVPKGEKVREHATPATQRVAAERRTSAAVRIHDLPIDPKRATVVGVVIFYTLLGVPDQDITEATGLTAHAIAEIRASDAYDEIRSTLVGRVRDAQQSEVRGMLQNGAVTAAETIIGLMTSSKDEAVKLRAAQDVLNRDGHRPVDVVEHRHTLDGEMRVRIVRDTTDPGTIELELETN